MPLNISVNKVNNRLDVLRFSFDGTFDGTLSSINLSFFIGDSESGEITLSPDFFVLPSSVPFDFDVLASFITSNDNYSDGVYRFIVTINYSDAVSQIQGDVSILFDNNSINKWMEAISNALCSSCCGDRNQYEISQFREYIQAANELFDSGFLSKSDKIIKKTSSIIN